MPYIGFVTSECIACNRLFSVRYSSRFMEKPQHFCSQQCVREYRSRPPYPEYDALTDCYRIPIIGGLYAIVDPVDVAVAAYKWTPQVSSTGTIYATRGEVINGSKTKFYMHRVILERAGIALSSKDHVDHWDHDGLNNRRNNLRKATPAQNGANSRRPITNTSGFKGVSFRKDIGRYEARIGFNRRSKILGYFSTPQEASAAYKAAAIAYYGEFANDGTDAA